MVDLPLRTDALEARWTPSWLADDMASLAKIGPHSDVLVPGAGRGALIRAAEAASGFTASIVAVELNEGLAAELKTSRSIAVHHGDYLRWGSGLTFQRALVNPPHDKTAEFLAATGHQRLASGGRLVALVHSAREVEATSVLPGARTYALAPNAFTDPKSGRTLATCLVVWDRP